MATALDTGRPVQTLTMSELLAIASVIVGRMDQDSDHMPYVHVSVRIGKFGPSVGLLTCSASHDQGAAFLDDLSRALDTPVEHREDFHIDAVICRDWEGTGVQVYAQAVVRDEKAA
ncbi:hypothetical protein [Nocardiopsis sp. LOL_012]|uniref:hypothetical protein n=1 Tax=Nocardiopsis sp. LOL_012 TaxID=3345409 RepID=UPI003A889B83